MPFTPGPRRRVAGPDGRRVVNLLNPSTTCKPSAEVFEGVDSATGEVKWTDSQVDLPFGSNSELCALAEVYASDAAEAKFVVAGAKVINLDRFELV